MFFNQDILFKDGPLAILWMAGNGDLRSKAARGRRNKNHQAILNSDIIALCDLVRKQFPAMGTANGISLKKVATLIKGLGIIYFSKMEELACCIVEMNIRMHTANAGRLRDITLPVAKTTPRQAAVTNSQTLDLQDLAFGDLTFGDMGFNNFMSHDTEGPRALPSALDDQDTYFRGQNIVPTPPRKAREERGKRKRRRSTEPGLDDGDVLNILREAIAQNPRANCITEHGLPNDPGNEFGFGDAFGEGDLGAGFFDVMHSALRTDTGDNLPGGTISAAEGLGSPTGRRSTRDLDDGEGRTGRRRPRSGSEDELGVQEQSSQGVGEFRLEEIDDRHGPRRRGRRRMRRRLEIDPETQVSMSILHDQIKQQRRPLNYEDLMDLADTKCAKLPGTLLKSRSDGLSIIHNVGRKIIGRGLSEFVDAHLVSIRSHPPRPVVDPGDSRELERQEEIPVANEESGSAEINRDGSSQPAMGAPLMDMQQHELAFEPFDHASDIGNSIVRGAVSNDMGQDHQNEVMDIGVPDMEYGHGENLMQDDDRTTFRKMFPPGQVSKTKAALGFFRLLRLQSKLQVVLEQDEPYGEIYVTQAKIKRS